MPMSMPIVIQNRRLRKRDCQFVFKTTFFQLIYVGVFDFVFYLQDYIDQTISSSHDVSQSEIIPTLFSGVEVDQTVRN